MNFVDELRDVVGRGKLRDAVPEIEDVSRVRAEAVQHGARLFANGGRRGKQDRLVEIAL